MSIHTLSNLLALMRPKHWIKNSFVLAPLVFAGEFSNPDAISKAIFACILFCLTSSTSYIINDILDVKSDRNHPVKSKTRPIAAGKVSLSQARILLILLYALLSTGFFIAPRVMLVLLAYVALNFAYSFSLKKMPVLDIFTIAIGFVLRVYAGAIAIDVPISSWMFVTTLCLALYLASIKRRQELVNSGENSREVLNDYSLPLIERYCEMSGVGALLFYSLYVMTANSKMVMSIPIVIFGLFRYWYIVERNGAGESPTDVLFSDLPIALTVIIWGGFCIWAMLSEGVQ